MRLSHRDSGRRIGYTRPVSFGDPDLLDPLSSKSTRAKYFAYGTNMSPELMREICPAAECLGPVRLPGYRLAFTRRSVRTGTGVADVLPDASAETWGVLYEIDRAARRRLDAKEGLGWAYDELCVTVEDGTGESHEAATYIVKRKEPRDIEPSGAYMDEILRAARARRLPAPYLKRLELLATRRSAWQP